MKTEQYFRSAGAVTGLLSSYVFSSFIGISGVTYLAALWAMATVIGGIFGQRIYKWKCG